MNNKSIIAAAIIAVALVAMAFVIKAGMDNRTFNGRTISVRGVATQTVTADYATAYITFSMSSAELMNAKASAVSQLDSTEKLALACGLKKESLQRNPISIEVRTIYDEYGRAAGTKYVASTSLSIYVEGDDVMSFNKFDMSRDRLIDMGVIIDWANIEYSFSDNALTKIKPEMLTTATENARLAAEQLASNNNCEVGNIVSASQGYFEINNIPGKPDYLKEVRVVNNAEFYLK